MRRALSRSFALGGALAALALVTAATTVVVQRVRYRRAFREAMVELQRCTPGHNEVEKIAWYGHEPEAVLALVKYVERCHDKDPRGWELEFARIALRHAVEVYAASATHDDSVDDMLRAWLARPEHAFLAHYLLDEIAHPRYGDAHAARARAAERAGDLPKPMVWCGARRPLPLAATEDAMQEPLKRLRAWAAISGCKVVDRGDLLEVARVAPTPP